jgi:uncharacterized membrane protein YcaP (DUF421 family)
MNGWHLLHGAMFGNLFGLKISILEKILRPILVYAFLVVMLRIFGKRELAQLNPFDLVVLLSLSNTVQNAIIGDDNTLLGGVIGAFSLLTTNYLVVRYLFRHRRLDQLVEGKPTVLIDKGKILKHNLAKELLTRAELVSVAHRQGFSGLDAIERCVLEPGGSFYICGKDPSQTEQRHGQLLEKLEKLSSQIVELERKLQNKPTSIS